MESEKQSDAYEYLFATIKFADWINPEYKKLAEKYRNNSALKTLYQCICDGVDIDVLELIEVNENTENILMECRKKYLESDFLRKYQQELERIRVITTSTEKEVKQMSGNVKLIADYIPTFDEMFQIQESSENIKINLKEKMWPEKENEIEMRDVPKIENIPKEITTPISIQSEQEKIMDWMEKIKVFFCNCFDKYGGRNSKKTMKALKKQGYSDEKIEFIYECYNEGIPINLIDKFIDPTLSVDNMKLLKRIKLREYKRNGYR